MWKKRVKFKDKIEFFLFIMWKSVLKKEENCRWEIFGFLGWFGVCFEKVKEVLFILNLRGYKVLFYEDVI